MSPTQLAIGERNSRLIDYVKGLVSEAEDFINKQKQQNSLNLESIKPFARMAAIATASLLVEHLGMAPSTKNANSITLRKFLGISQIVSETPVSPSVLKNPKTLLSQPKLDTVLGRQELRR